MSEDESAVVDAEEDGHTDAGTGTGDVDAGAETGETDGDDETATGAQEAASLEARVAAHDEALAEEVATLGARLAERADRVETLEAELEDREARLEEKDRRIEEVTERVQRTQADFQNYKKRAKKRQRQLEERATADLVARLLDVREDLGRALDVETGDADALREGVELTASEFDRVLESEGVTEITPEAGDDVDPSRHEVMLRVESDHPEGSVVDVYRTGYEMGEKVLRTAQVTVSEGASEDASDE